MYVIVFKKEYGSQTWGPELAISSIIFITDIFLSPNLSVVSIRILKQVADSGRWLTRRLVGTNQLTTVGGLYAMTDFRQL